MSTSTSTAAVGSETASKFEHALASKRLYAEGAEVLYDYAASEHDEELRGLTVVRMGQRQFAEVVCPRLAIRYPANVWHDVWHEADDDLPPR
jgi:hypothetical protein